jgi:hypothetical protein
MVVDDVFNLFIDNVELVEKLFKLSNVVVDVESKKLYFVFVASIVKAVFFGVAL